MLQRPAFKPYFHLETVENEGIFLLSEHGHFVLTGHLNDLVVPLIDGRRTCDEIADALAGKAKMEEIYYVLAFLEKNGHLVEADAAMQAERAAFWSALGVETQLAHDRLTRASIAVRNLGGDGEAALTDALERLGVATSSEGDFTVVIVADYLQSELATINRAHLERGKPWMLVRPRGYVAWVGPIFVPGQTGCWECLAQRLRNNREVECFIERKGRPGPFPVARTRIPALSETASQLAALQSAIFLGTGGRSPLVGSLSTTNLADLANAAHVLIRRPQCAACGNPEAWKNSDDIVSLADSAKTYLQDGGHRSVTPEATYDRFRHHVSPITGVVSSLAPSSGLDSGPLRVYVAGHNFALKNDSLYFLRDGLRSNSAGKGMTDAQARTSALCEAIERYSGVYRGEEKRVRATYRELGASAVHPNACMLFSERQYADRLHWLARQSRFQVVPLPFQEEVELDWTPVHSLTSGASKYLPTGYLYYGYPFPDEEFYYWADSNGNAAGNTVEEAILQGFLELVERDSVAIWWYNRLRRPAVDLASLEEPYLQGLHDYYRARGREFWVLDLSADTGIPAFGAISRRVDHPVEDIVMGFGAHLDPRVGILRAITEMNQFMPAVLGRQPNGETVYAFDDRDSIAWWRSATLANQPYLTPLSAPFTRKLSDFTTRCTANVSDDVRVCVGIAARLGLETLVLNQTRPDVGLNVVKVMVPGLRHFWARFAPGRLYDVPVKMGWLSGPTPEAFLNPVPMFV